MQRVLQNFIFIIILFFLFLPCYYLKCESYPFTSISELIEFETAEILNSDTSDYLILSEKYLSRAESYLIAKNYDLAFSDFCISYKLAILCDEACNKFLLFQSLFGQAIIYGCLDMPNEFQLTLNALGRILDSYSCTSCGKYNYAALLARTEGVDRPFYDDNAVFLQCNTQRSIKSSVEPPIYGPDRISISECIEFARGMAKKCRYLISLVPKSEVKVLLSIAIDGLENKAIDCCRAGGIWKSCLQPLANKWYLWNQKYQMFGIPPDPTWD